MYLSFIKLALITWKKKQELQFILFKLIYSLMNRLAQAQTRKKHNWAALILAYLWPSIIFFFKKLIKRESQS